MIFNYSRSHGSPVYHDIWAVSGLVGAMAPLISKINKTKLSELYES